MSLRDTLRRILWITFVLLAVSVVSFWGFTKYVDREPNTANAQRFANLPVFVNAHPRNARDLSLGAMREVAQGRPGAELARAKLVRLGGAALPHVLPELDTLDSAGRARVALALVPVAERMGLAEAGELANAEQAVPFWARFWQDRAIDFRPQVVKRLVARVAERSFALRREDIQYLDTYAASSLIDMLGRVRSESDAGRVRRISAILSHVTQLNLRLEKTASVADAARVAERWYAWWDENGADYSTLEGPRRVTAVVTETRYAKWIAAARRGGFGKTLAQGTALELVATRIRFTALLLVIALGVGTPLGFAWTYVEERPQTPKPARVALGSVAGALAALPIAVFGARNANGSFALVLLLGTFTSAAFISRQLRSLRLFDDEPGFRERIGEAVGAVAPAASVHAGWLLSGVLGLEIAFGLPGLGEAAAAALRLGDTNAWMAATLTTALLVLLVRHVADIFFMRMCARGARSSGA